MREVRRPRKPERNAHFPGGAAARKHFDIRRFETFASNREQSAARTSRPIAPRAQYPNQCGPSRLCRPLGQHGGAKRASS